VFTLQLYTILAHSPQLQVSFTVSLLRTSRNKESELNYHQRNVVYLFVFLEPTVTK